MPAVRLGPDRRIKPFTNGTPLSPVASLAPLATMGLRFNAYVHIMGEHDARLRAVPVDRAPDANRNFPFAAPYSDDQIPLQGRFPNQEQAVFLAVLQRSIERVAIGLGLVRAPSLSLFPCHIPTSSLASS